MDHQIRSAVTDGLRRREVDVLTAFEDGFSRSPDDGVLQRATELGRVLFTHDTDFLAIAHHWQSIGQEFTGVVYAHQEDMPIGKMIDDLELIAKAADPEDLWNRVEYLPL
jgi:hypothetical protein